MCVLLITRLLWGVGRWARKPVNRTSWVVVVTPTDRPKSVRNFVVALFVFSLCPFDISVGVGAFVIGLSLISSFLSLLPNIWGFHRTEQLMRLANRGRLLLRMPDPVPFGTCISSNVETILSWTCHIYGPFGFRTSLGTSILLHVCIVCLFRCVYHAAASDLFPFLFLLTLSLTHSPLSEHLITLVITRSNVNIKISRNLRGLQWR